MQKWYQWKVDELVFTYRPHANIQINWLYNNGPLNMDYLFFDTHCIAPVLWIQKTICLKCRVFSRISHWHTCSKLVGIFTIIESKGVNGYTFLHDFFVMKNHGKMLCEWFHQIFFFTEFSHRHCIIIIAISLCVVSALRKLPAKFSLVIYFSCKIVLIYQECGDSACRSHNEITRQRGQINTIGVGLLRTRNSGKVYTVCVIILHGDFCVWMCSQHARQCRSSRIVFPFLYSVYKWKLRKVHWTLSRVLSRMESNIFLLVMSRPTLNFKMSTF